jgi:hypothetical protein
MTCTLISTLAFSANCILESGNAKPKMASQAFFFIKNIQQKKDTVPKLSKKKFQKVHVVTLICQFGTPEQTEERLFRVEKSTDFKNEQQTFIAIEFDLIEGNDSLESAVHHFKWDLLKLRSVKNGVEHGYALVFVRDWAHRDNFLEEIEKEVANEQRITVLYAEKKGNDRIVGRLSKKPFLTYELPFK